MFGIRKRNPTAGWDARLGTVLTLDLGAFTLGGAAVGDHADALSLLGPGEPGTAVKEYHFPAWGVTLEIAGDSLAAFHVHFPAFGGIVRSRGNPVTIGTLDGLSACVDRFGEPDVVEDEILTYLADGREWELILENGRVKTISLCIDGRK